MEMIVYPEELMAKRIAVLEAENERLRTEITRLQGSDILYYEMPGGVRFPVGKAVREGFIPETAQGYVVQPTITIPEGASAITVSADGTVSVQVAGQHHGDDIARAALGDKTND